MNTSHSDHLNLSVTSAVSFGTYVLVACVAGATLGLELIQTRVLSFLYYNHVVYLTVTIALLGFGISGVFVSLFSSHCRNPSRMIACLTTGFLFSSFLCLAIVSRIPQFLTMKGIIIKLLLSYLILVIPFLFSGAILGWIFMLNAQRINRLYFVDLVCGSAAVVTFVFLLWPIGGNWFVWLCSSIILVGLLYHGRHALLKREMKLILLFFFISILLLNKHVLSNQPEIYKMLGHAFKSPTAKIESTQWTPTTRIDLWSDPFRDPFSEIPQFASDVKMITQDADAFTMLWGPQHVVYVLNAAKSGKLITALSLTYYLNKNPDNSLVIGVGGGIDMLMAKAHGAKKVTGVEINPATMHLIQGPYRHFLLWPTWEGVNLVRSEGRNYLRTKKRLYDTIVMSGVDTFSALNSGAYVLSENYLYTVEAIQDYLNALKPNGVMAIYRWFFLKPRESLRIASLYRAAAERMQIKHPEQCIMVISEDLGWSTYRWAATFIKKTPFTQAQVQEVLALIKNTPTMSAIYLPKIFQPAIQERLEKEASKKDPQGQFAMVTYNKLLASNKEDHDRFINNYEYRIDPVQDDRPFFFEYYKNKLSDFYQLFHDLKEMRAPTSLLYVLLLVCLLICFMCIMVPLFIFQKRGIESPGSSWLLLFFGALGFGFMVFEIGAMQMINLYIGDPIYSMGTVLAGLLVATGLGSAMSEYFSETFHLKTITNIMLVIMFSILTWIGFTHWIQPMTMELPITLRALIVFLTLLPVGMCLGLPFPTAVRELEKNHSHFIAWAWGINGVTSVLSSIIAIVVAMKMGFTVVVLMSVVAYFIGMVCYRQYFLRA